MALASATRVGPYEIVSVLGAGAMGEVYRARDSRLDREIALKVLSEECLGDTVKRRRFIQEARSASSLNHPNIVVVHDYGTEDGISYIASELIDGHSLRELIRGGPVPIAELLDIAIQIAEGIAAAHAAGIVHRDLKPENIMLTRQNRVKLLDFGLAKPVMESNACDDGAELTMDGFVTEPGLVVGTVGYMSPEQARGLQLTVQSDQFSFGLILHEMATGQPAFKGDTPMQTLFAIANAGQPPFTPGPAAFRLLVERCLRRDPEKRFSDTAEMATRLRKIRDELPLKTPARPALSTGLQKVAYQVPARWRYIGLAACAAIALAAYVLARLFAWHPPSPDAITYEPAIAQTGFDAAPAVDSSGRMLAWSGASAGILQIFTARAGADDGAPITSQPANCLFPVWSHDGERVFFISEHGGAPALWSVPAAGGPAEPVVDNVARAAVSPAGDSLALLRPVQRGSTELAVWLLRLPERTTAIFAPLHDRRFPEDTFAGFSPNGSRLGVFSADGNFLVAALNGGRIGGYRLANDYGPHPFAWTAHDRIYWGAGHLRVADLRQGRVWQVSNGSGVEGWPSAAAGRMFLATARPSWRVASFDGAGHSVEGPLAGRDAVWSPTGRQFAWIESAGGRTEIRIRDALSGWERVVVRAADFRGAQGDLSSIAFAPDGRRLAVVRSQGSSQIWIVGLNGQQPVRAVPADGSAADERQPAWSPDGQWLAFMSSRNGQSVLMKARAGATGAPAVIASVAARQPVWSADGRFITALADDGGVDIVPAGGGPIRKAGDGLWLCAAWDGDGIRGIREVNHRLEFTRLNPASGVEERIADAGPAPAAFAWATALGEPSMSRASISRDGIFTTTMMNAQSSIWSAQGLE